MHKSKCINEARRARSRLIHFQTSPRRISYERGLCARLAESYITKAGEAQIDIADSRRQSAQEEQKSLTKPSKSWQQSTCSAFKYDALRCDQKCKGTE